MWYDTAQNKEVWWYTYDPMLQKAYATFVMKKYIKETGTVCKSLTWGCLSNKTEENVYPFLHQFCKQCRKQHNNNHFVSIKLTAKDGEQKAKKATQISDPKTLFQNQRRWSYCKRV